MEQAVIVFDLCEIPKRSVFFPQTLVVTVEFTPKFLRR